MILGVLLLAAAAWVVVTRVRAPRNGAVTQSSSAVLLRALADSSSARDRDWIAAMVAEHDAIADPAGRRRFARGCLAALATTPRGGDTTAWLIRVIVGGAVAAAVALAGFGLWRYPGLRVGVAWLVYLAIFAVALTACALAGYLVARIGSPAGRVSAVGMALPALLLSWYAAAHNSATAVGAALAVVLLPGAAGAVARRIDRTRVAAVAAAALCAVTTGLLSFIGYVATTYATHGGAISPSTWAEYLASGAPDYPTWAVSDNLGGACFLLVFIPLVGLAAGILTAALPPAQPIRTTA
jgi:hypothetical protein